VRRGPLAALLLGAFALSGWAACARRGAATSGGAGAGAEAETSYGPRERLPPAGATIAHDEAELLRFVADPAGPRDVWLEPKRYAVTLSIKRPFALHGRRGARLSGPGEGTVVSIAADDVTIEDVAIDGAGQRHTTEDSAIKAKGNRVAIRNVFADRTLFGISLEECHDCSVEGSLVRGADVVEAMRGDGIKVWESHGSLVRGNRVENARDVVVWYSRKVHLDSNVVIGCRYGTHFMYAHDSSVDRSRMQDDVVGVFVMYSARLHASGNVISGAHGAAGIGFGFKESDAVTLEGNVLAGNTTGIYLDRTPRDLSQTVHFTDNVFGANDVALRFHSSGGGAIFAGNSFKENRALVEVEGGGDALGMKFEGNYWSDYDGYDLDGDGFGDLRFEHKQLSSELEQSRPALAFFRGTLAIGMIDAVSRAFPLLSSRTLLLDPKPSMRPPASSQGQRLSEAHRIARLP
jgi:nitrous oxidase accessory protein